MTSDELRQVVLLVTCHLSLVTVFLQFPQHQIFQKDVMRGEGGDAEAGQTVAPTALEDEVADERGRPDCGDLPRRRAPALLEHLARGERRIAFTDHAMMMRSIAHGVVQKIALQCLLARGGRELDRLVYVSALPTPTRSSVETQLPIRIPTAAANPTPHVKRTPRHHITIRELRLVRVEQIFN